MGYYRNFNGKRYHTTITSVTKQKAQSKAKEYRKRGILARASPDSDNRGYYAVYICKK